MITDSVRKLFGDLSIADEAMRQQKQARIDRTTVFSALDDIGLFNRAAGDVSMASAQVQVLVAREAGAVALPYPVTETLAAHAVAERGGCADVSAKCSMGTSIGEECEEAPLQLGAGVSGRVARVPLFKEADALWVRARSESGRTLVLVSARDAGIEGRAVRSVEADYELHDLRMRGVATLRVLEKFDSGVCASRFLDQRVGLLAAAEISGACHRMVMMTRDHLLTRSQFGQVLGANQALRHALADAYVRVEAMLASIKYAAATCDAGAADAEVAVYAAKHYANRAGKTVADSMLQLHGAIGYTMEFPLHLLMRRVHRLCVSHGTMRRLSDSLFQGFQAQR